MEKREGIRKRDKIMSNFNEVVGTVYTAKSLQIHN